MESLKAERRFRSMTNQMGSSYQQWQLHDLDVEQLLGAELAIVFRARSDSEPWLEKWATTSPEKQPLGLAVVAAHKYWQSHGHDGCE